MTSTHPFRSGLSTTILLISFGLFLSWSRIHTREQPVQYDQAFASVIGHEWLAGRSLYTDLWDLKPPVLFWSYAVAERIAGYGESELLFINLTAGWMILLLLYVAASRWGQDRTAGLWSAGIWSLFSGDLLLEGNLPNGELFVNLCSIAIICLVLKPDDTQTPQKTRWRYFFIGLLSALAFAYKPIFAPISLAILLADVWSANPCDRIPKLYSWGIAGIGAVMGTLAWIIPYMVNGQGEALYYAILQFNPAYVREGPHYTGFWANVWTSVRFPIIINDENVRREALLCLVPPALYSFAGLWKTHSQPTHWKVWIGYALGTHVAVMLPGRYYSHYYQLWLPVLAIGSGWTMAALYVRSRRLVYVFAGAALLASILPGAIRPFLMSPEDCSRWVWGERFVTGKRVGLEIGRQLPAGQSFYHWGHEPSLYFYSQRSPSSGIIGMAPLFYGTRAPEFNRRLISDLSKPDSFLVIGTRWSLDMKNPPSSLEWILSRFKPAPGVRDLGPFQLRIRTDAVHRIGDPLDKK